LLLECLDLRLVLRKHRLRGLCGCLRCGDRLAVGWYLLPVQGGLLAVGVVLRLKLVLGRWLLLWWWCLLWWWLLLSLLLDFKFLLDFLDLLLDFLLRGQDRRGGGLVVRVVLFRLLVRVVLGCGLVLLRGLLLVGRMVLGLVLLRWLLYRCRCQGLRLCCLCAL
jgi:hypothetical protein